MPTLSRYLRRFRRLVSPPGRPGPSAVPADRAADLHDELADVLAAIDAIQQEADRIREEAEKQAHRRRREGEEQAQRVLARAHEDAEAVQADESARRREEIEEEIDKIYAAGGDAADDIADQASQVLNDLADRIVPRIFDAEPGSVR